MAEEIHRIMIEVLYLTNEKPEKEMLNELNRDGMHCSYSSDLAKLLDTGNEMAGRRKLILIDQRGIDISSTMKYIRLTVEYPVVVLLSSDDPHEEVRCFNCGVDDCVVPGRGHKVLRERIFGVVRRSGLLQRKISAGHVEIEPDTYGCWVQEKRVFLTPKEFSLLEYLMTNQEQVLTRENILTALWGFDYEGGTRTVDTVIKQLRRKLGSASNLIRSVYGVGYKFTVSK